MKSLSCQTKLNYSKHRIVGQRDKRKRQQQSYVLAVLKIIMISLVLSGSFSLAAQARVYVYKTPSGSSLITDSKINKKGYRLKRSYNTKPYGSSSSSRPYYAKPIQSQYES